MEKENLLRNYWTLGINSQANLFDFVSNNTEAVVDDRKYNLKKSNECIEFMAGFLEALNFEVFRLYLNKTKDVEEGNIENYWFLAFSNGFKWFYYEPRLEGVKGQYTFSNYDSLTTFAVSRVISFSENNSNLNLDIYEKYSLKEIEPLQNFMLRQDIKQSKQGKEILLWDALGKQIDFEQRVKNAEIEEIENRDNRISRVEKRQGKFFWLGFIPTLAIGIGLLWYLANFFYGN